VFQVCAKGFFRCCLVLAVSGGSSSAPTDAVALVHVSLFVGLLAVFALAIYKNNTHTFFHFATILNVKYFYFHLNSIIIVSISSLLEQ
jgi:hypothetical protein